MEIDQDILLAVRRNVMDLERVVADFDNVKISNREWNCLHDLCVARNGIAKQLRDLSEGKLPYAKSWREFAANIFRRTEQVKTFIRVNRLSDYNNERFAELRRIHGNDTKITAPWE